MKVMNTKDYRYFVEIRKDKEILFASSMKGSTRKVLRHFKKNYNCRLASKNDIERISGGITV